MDTLCSDADVFAHVCVRVCSHLCAHAMWRRYGCAHVIREIKLPFQDNAISLYHLYLIYALNPIIFCHVGLFLYFHVRK